MRKLYFVLVIIVALTFTLKIFQIISNIQGIYKNKNAIVDTVR